MPEQTQDWLPWTVALVASLMAAMTDLRSGKIYNWLTGPLFLAGVIWSGTTLGWSGAGQSVAAALFLAAPFVLLFLFGGGGAADAKLMGSLGAWLGWEHCIPVLVAVLISGAVFGLGYAIAKGKASGVLINLWIMTFGLVQVALGQTRAQKVREMIPQPSGMLRIPYGVAIFAGICISVVLQRSVGES